MEREIEKLRPRNILVVHAPLGEIPCPNGRGCKHCQYYNNYLLKSGDKSNIKEREINMDDEEVIFL